MEEMELLRVALQVLGKFHMRVTICTRCMVCAYFKSLYFVSHVCDRPGATSKQFWHVSVTGTTGDGDDSFLVLCVAL